MANTTIFSDLARRLRRTDLLLLRAVRRQRARPAMRAKGQFWGSVITDDEVDALLRAHGEIDYPAESDGLDDAIAASTAYRDAPRGKLHQLREAFSLDGDEMDLILLTLAPEISAGYGKIFAYLNDNLNQAYLTVDLATRIFTARATPTFGATIPSVARICDYSKPAVTPQPSRRHGYPHLKTRASCSEFTAMVTDRQAHIHGGRGETP